MFEELDLKIGDKGPSLNLRPGVLTAKATCLCTKPPNCGGGGGSAKTCSTICQVCTE
jgi:hypothetical protein